MLIILSRWSKKMVWAKPVSLLIGCVAIVVFIATANKIPFGLQEINTISGSLIFVWSLLLTIMLSVYPKVPARLSAIEELFRRLKIRNQRGIFFLLNLFFFLLNLEVILLGLESIGNWN